MTRRHVLMTAGEALPFMKTGGLGDVLGALPRHLSRAGHAVSVVVPYYLPALPDAPTPHRIMDDLEVTSGGHLRRLSVYRSTIDDEYDIFLIRHDPYFQRPHPYGPNGSDYPDNAQRFALFSNAVTQLIQTFETPVDIVHCHDWQTALVPFYLGGTAPTVFTIHNLGYQGIFPAQLLPQLDISEEQFHPEGVEFYGRINFLKAGIIWSDAVTTVSPQYSLEMRQPEHGFGLDGLLRKYAFKLRGILNGADYTLWDPRLDGRIAAQYSLDDLSGKRLCARRLEELVCLPPDAESPIVGMTSRLARQKGIDIVVEALPELMERPLRLVILGSGDAGFEAELRAATARFLSLAVIIGFDEDLAHAVMAGSDAFLMPSRYEPCGLSQLYALRYGTVPIVRATGGLKDTVAPHGGPRFPGTGFVFDGAAAADLLGAVDRCLGVWRRRDEWRELMRRGMAQDFSWDRSAAVYGDLYEEVIGRSGRIAQGG